MKASASKPYKQGLRGWVCNKSFHLRLQSHLNSQQPRQTFDVVTNFITAITYQPLSARFKNRCRSLSIQASPDVWRNVTKRIQWRSGAMDQMATSRQDPDGRWWLLQVEAAKQESHERWRVVEVETPSKRHPGTDGSWTGMCLSIGRIVAFAELPPSSGRLGLSTAAWTDPTPMPGPIHPSLK